MLKANYHTHTVLCDGKNTAEEMVKRALDLGFEHLGFSGHMDPGVHMDWPIYVAEVRRLQGIYGERLDLLRGSSSVLSPLAVTGTRSLAPTMSSRRRCMTARTVASWGTLTS